jgi:tetratricopeptide (TPR) repeat protein
MLATNLARVPGLQVVSTLRMLELVHRQRGEDTVGAVAAAAREAGATELLEGGIHAGGGNKLVLELRRVDLATGSVRSASRIEGTDLFELVTAATREISADLGHPGGSLDLGEVSTRSLIAYRLYEEGLRQFARGDYRNAMSLFESSVQEDSSFAMAEYYRMWSGTAIGISPTSAQVGNLDRLASRATERERLIIRIWLAAVTQTPGILAIAESLAARYPTEIDGHYQLGAARMVRSEFLAAIPHLQRALALDSTSLSSRSARCVACLALSHIGFALHAVDSLPRAIASARAWVARDSGSSIAWRELARVLLVSGRYDEAVDTWKRAPNDLEGFSEVFPASADIYRGRFAQADDALRNAMQRGSEAARFEARWYLAISLRYQGRWEESVRLMRERVASLTPDQREGDHDFLPLLAVTLAWYEGGRVPEAMAWWDSTARTPRPVLKRGDLHRRQTYLYTLLTEAAHGVGDPSGVARYADSATAWAARGENPRDIHIARHARGIALLERGDTVAAIATLRDAIFSPTTGFTRTNLMLGQLLTATGKPEEAVAILRPALHGALEAANLYVTRTDIQEEMSRAFQALGQRDSAQAYASLVAKALENGEAHARKRIAAVRAELR